MKLPIQITFFAALVAVVLVCSNAAIAGDYYNKRGNILIADQFNNRVLEVDPKTNEIIWSWGDGSSVAGPTSVVAPNDFQRIGEVNLVAGTGAPPGAEPDCPNGCADNRVMLINNIGHIVWQYGQAGVTGSDFDQLNTPVQNTYLPNGDILISDQGNQRVIEVNKAKQIVWQQGKTGVAGAKFNQLNNPNSAELLDNGDILIADESNNRVIEVDRHHRIVWHYGSPNGTAAQRCRVREPVAEWQYADHRCQQQPHCRGNSGWAGRVAVCDEHAAGKRSCSTADAGRALSNGEYSDQRSIQPSGD